jgi:CTP:molybdopterin cytidylyltransferase MocA
MITAILLAAGQSKRVPTKNKLLIKYRKKIINQSYFRVNLLKVKFRK